MTPNLNTFSPTSYDNTSASILPQVNPPAHVAVIGAGCFGGWTALSLRRQGFQVTLFDAWGPGNSRSSSGDETRVIRSTYGSNEFYFDMNVRALSLWKENEIRFNKKLFYNTGVLWLCYDEYTPVVDDSLPFAKKHDMPYEFLTPAELNRRYHLLNVTDLTHGYFDPFGGYLKAREATIAVVDAFINEGGRYIASKVVPGNVQGDTLENICLENGNKHNADLYIFACGSWLSTLFPGRLDDVISCSKQEVYYFGCPSSEAIAFDSFPVWIDADGKDFYYGIPNNAGRGFKIGVDRRGQPFDPTSSERVINADTLEHARTFLTHRFPSLKDAPLVESRVCPYENSSDGNFIFDLLPGTTNSFILGGGSGHGFKHGPALGELIARLLQGHAPYPEILRIKY